MAEALLRRDGRAGVRRLRPRLLPAPLELRADERRDRPRRLEPRGADALDARGGEGASICAPSSGGRAPALVLAGEDDAWAPLESVREVATLLPGRPLPELPVRGRHSIFRDAPESYEELRVFLDEVRAAEGAVVKVAVSGTELFFDVDGAAVGARRPVDARAPDRGPPADLAGDRPLALQGAHRAGARRGRAGDLPRPARLRPERLGRAGGVDARHLGRRTSSAFCDALELERPALLGTAVGGVIALQYAARHPDRVERLVLVSVAARHVHTRSIAVFDRIGGPEAGEVAARYFADPTEANFGEFMRVCVPLVHPDAGDARRGRAGRDERRADGALGARRPRGTTTCARRRRRVACPTLLLAGDDDPGDDGRGHGRSSSAALPPGVVRYERYPETGHGVFADRPEAIDLVQEFLAPPEPA